MITGFPYHSEVALDTGTHKREIYGIRWKRADLANRSIQALNDATEYREQRIRTNDSVVELVPSSS